MRPCFFIFGFGYTAQSLANQLTQRGFTVIGTSRDVSNIQPNPTAEIRLINFDSPDIESYFSQATHLLVSTPPSDTNIDPVLAKYSAMIKNHATHIQWAGYLSSTGVYGDHQGEWVNETSDCRPCSFSGKSRLTAENDWLSLAKLCHLPLHIFRLAGIYGPRRNPLERLKAGKKYRLFKEGQVFSRIHVEDIVSVLLSSMNSINPLSIYNVADDEPEASHIVDEFAASLLSIDPPPLLPIEQAALSQMEKGFYASNRRISNLKIKNELHVTLKYPSYREGLTQLWQDYFINK